MALRKRSKTSTAPAATSESRVTILLEDIQGKVQATMEAVTGLRGELHSEIETLRTELSRRIDVLELAVQQNSADIRKNSEAIRKNSEDIQKNSEDIRKNSEDIRKNSVDICTLREDIRDLRVQLGDVRLEIGTMKEEIRSMRELLERKPDHEALLKLEARVAVLERRLGIQ